MSRQRLEWVLFAILGVALAAVGAEGPGAAKSPAASKPASGEPAGLDKRYVDALHGFSLRPPALTERSRELSPAKLVSWSKRDPQTGAVAYTLSVLRVLESHQVSDMDAYAKALTAKLSRDEGFKLESLQVKQVAGRPAIDLTGLTSGQAQMWQHQNWVLSKPGVFLVVVMAGPVKLKDQLEEIHGQVLATMQVTDPEKAREQQRENVQRAQDMLGGCNTAKLLKLLIPQRQHFLVKLKNQNVGFLAQSEAAGREKDASGIVVTTWVMMQMPGDQPRLMKRVLFTSPDSSIERWQEQFQMDGPAGTRPLLRAEDGMTVNGLIVCQIDDGTKISTQKKPGVPKDMYLPRALGYMLPRLVDLKTPGAYTFAAYTTETNDLDMRTLTVAGPERIEIAGQTVECVKLMDQLSMADEPATVWVDSTGRLLRMETAEGLVIESASREAVLQKYPNAESLIGAMAKWAAQK